MGPTFGPKRRKNSLSLKFKVFFLLTGVELVLELILARLQLGVRLVAEIVDNDFVGELKKRVEKNSQKILQNFYSTKRCWNNPRFNRKSILPCKCLHFRDFEDFQFCRRHRTLRFESSHSRVHRAGPFVGCFEGHRAPLGRPGEVWALIFLAKFYLIIFAL